MTLVIDIGNTNIVCGRYADERLVWHARFSTDQNRTSDEYYAALIALAGAQQDVSAIAIASVVPELTRVWQHLCSKYYQAPVYIVNAYSPLGLSYNVADPGFIGADLVVNAFAAWQKYNTHCLIVDLGTATTIQLVTREGRFMGTVIAPGLRTGASYLFEKASLLSAIELTSPEVTLGTTTRDAMLSGIVTGHACMIESFIQKLRKEYTGLGNIQAIATGGIADLIMPLVPSLDILDKTLTLEGLYRAVRLMHKESHSL